MFRQAFVILLVFTFSLFYIGCEQGMEPISDSQSSTELFQITPSSNLVWPAGTMVDQAVFSIFVHSTWGDTKVEAFVLTSDWSETGVSWNWADFNNNIPWGTPGGDIGVKVGEFDVPWNGLGAWYDVDVTAAVNDWIANEGSNNFGIILKHSVVNPVYARVQYHSSEYDDVNLRPKFTLYHNGSITEIQTGNNENVFDAWFDSFVPNTNYGDDPNLQTRIIFDTSTPPNIVREKRVVAKFPMEIEQQQKECETAFAWGDSYANCFIPDWFNNWGWTNGLLSPGSYTFDVYAGAGQCDLSKGTLVGNVTFDYDDVAGEVSVTYNMDEGFTMSEVHFYAGNEPFPRDKKGRYTNALGKFTLVDDNLNGVSTWSGIVDNLTGPIYVIAHAVVCGQF